jgi:hypothetical protein
MSVLSFAVMLALEITGGSLLVFARMCVIAPAAGTRVGGKVTPPLLLLLLLSVESSPPVTTASGLILSAYFSLPRLCNPDNV